MTKLTKTNKLVMLLAPVISLCILTIGNGFFITLTTIQLKNLHTVDWLIGLISAAYFAGLMVASYRVQQFIIRVGHIRAYAAFASLVAVCSLFQGLTNNIMIWLVARYVCGYCMAGLFIVIESWCLEGCEAKIKGQVLSFYLFSYYLALTLGQMLLKIHYYSMLIPFCIIAGTASLSILPVTMTRFEAPKISPHESASPLEYFKKIPLGVLGSFISGLLLSGIYAILPLTLKALHFSLPEIAYLMSITILGGTLFQIPIGKLSDKFDRRLILLIVAMCCCVLSILLILINTNFLTTMLLVFLLGGSTFVIYPLSISHATDYTKQTNTITVLSTLSLAYGCGSTIGPIIIANFAHWLGATIIFYIFAASGLFLFSYTLWRIYIREKAPKSNTASFVPIAQEMVIGTEQALNKELNK